MLITLLFALMISGQDQVVAPAQDGPRVESAAAPAAGTQALASNADDQRVVCRRERETGSNRSRNVCTRVGVADYNREAARRWRDNVVDSRGTPACATDPSSICPEPRN
ncbi:MAG: hypothetical protein REJ23_11800 [Brevundimonas sp.]|nr:hypothetical protein [Brevundimonas sp.]